MLEYCPENVRPLTSETHLEKEYQINRSNATEEDLLAFAWAWNPRQFPDPDIIGKILTYRSEELHFHTFNIETIIKTAELADLYSHDLALGKGLYSENIIVFKLGIPTPNHFLPDNLQKCGLIPL